MFIVLQQCLHDTNYYFPSFSFSLLSPSPPRISRQVVRGLSENTRGSEL